MGKIKFDPQRYRPIPNGGHPDLNPDSVAYQEYWAQETDRCLHGYKPKGMKAISGKYYFCLLYTSPSPRDLSTSRMPSSA